MKHDLKKIQNLDRNQLKAYCDTNNFVYRNKDSTEDIKKKLIRFLSIPNNSIPIDAKSTKKIENKINTKKVETKKVETKSANNKKIDNKKKDNNIK